jgi:hypothetical protein
MQDLLYGKCREYNPWTAPASAPCVYRRPV